MDKVSLDFDQSVFTWQPSSPYGPKRSTAEIIDLLDIDDEGEEDVKLRSLLSTFGIDKPNSARPRVSKQPRHLFLASTRAPSAAVLAPTPAPSAAVLAPTPAPTPAPHAAGQTSAPTTLSRFRAALAAVPDTSEVILRGNKCYYWNFFNVQELSKILGSVSVHELKVRMMVAITLVSLRAFNPKPPAGCTNFLTGECVLDSVFNATFKNDRVIRIGATLSREQFAGLLGSITIDAIQKFSGDQLVALEREAMSESTKVVNTPIDDTSTLLNKACGFLLGRAGCRTAAENKLTASIVSFMAVKVRFFNMIFVYLLIIIINIAARNRASETW